MLVFHPCHYVPVHFVFGSQFYANMVHVGEERKILHDLTMEIVHGFVQRVFDWFGLLVIKLVWL